MKSCLLLGYNFSHFRSSVTVKILTLGFCCGCDREKQREENGVKSGITRVVKHVASLTEKL